MLVKGKNKNKKQLTEVTESKPSDKKMSRYWFK